MSLANHHQLLIELVYGHNIKQVPNAQCTKKERMPCKHQHLVTTSAPQYVFPHIVLAMQASLPIFSNYMLKERL